MLFFVQLKLPGLDLLWSLHLVFALIAEIVWRMWTDFQRIDVALLRTEYQKQEMTFLIR
jgi:hypothetical protein